MPGTRCQGAWIVGSTWGRVVRAVGGSGEVAREERGCTAAWGEHIDASKVQPTLQGQHCTVGGFINKHTWVGEGKALGGLGEAAWEEAVREEAAGCALHTLQLTATLQCGSNCQTLLCNGSRKHRMWRPASQPRNI